MKPKNLIIASAVLLIIAFVAGAYFYKGQQAQQAAQLAANNQTLLLRSHSPTFGDANAPIQIVEFLDPACGTCRDFFPLVKSMMAAHPGKIRLTVRYTPFHPGSDQVVQVLEAARRQGQFQPTLEALFASQSMWVQNHKAQIAMVWPQLEGLGLDLNRIRSDMGAPEIARRIAQDLADAKTLNVTKTPEFFVNGKPLPSFGYEELKRLVDAALAAGNPN